MYKTVVIGCGTGLNGGVNGSHVVWLCVEHTYKPAYVSVPKPFMNKSLGDNP